MSSKRNGDSPKTEVPETERKGNELIMPKASGKKPQTITSNEYLFLLRSLKGDALKNWNREVREEAACFRKKCSK